MKKVKKNNRRFRHFWKKTVALGLSLGLSFTAVSCGKKEDHTGKNVGSIFDLFEEEGEDPFANATELNTEEHTGGDTTYDPFTVEPSTDTTESTEKNTESSGLVPEKDTNTYATTENQELNDIFQEYFADTVQESILTYKQFIRYDGAYGIDPPEEVTLGDIGITRENAEEVKKELEEEIARLEAIDLDTLTEQQRFDYDYLMDKLVSGRVRVENYKLSTSFGPMTGLQTNMSQIFTDYNFYTKNDVDIYIAILNLLNDYIRELLAEESAWVEEGYGQEDIVLDSMIKQCDDCLAQSLDENLIVVSFEETMEKLDFLTETEKEEYKKQNREAVEKSYIPAYEAMKSAFESWKGKRKVGSGLCSFGQAGNDYYAFRVKTFSGSDKTPEEMMDYLELKSNEATSELRAMYITNAEAMLYYEANRNSLYDYLETKDPEEFERYLMENTMGEFPKIDQLNFTVSKFSPALEKIDKNTLAYFMPPALDDPDGNLIRINESSMEDYWETLAHEGCPGHMYQRNYYLRTDPKPFRFLSSDLGYVEGWAVYAEKQTKKYCDYNGNQYSKELAKIDNLYGALSYSIYGIVDIGINAKGWTVEDVRNYLSDKGYESGAAEKMYTYLAGDPGAYLSYCAGYFEMQDMRDYAEEQLGSKFDVVEYHKVVLEAGPCNYSQLKKRVDKFILENK